MPAFQLAHIFIDILQLNRGFQSFLNQMQICRFVHFHLSISLLQLQLILLYNNLLLLQTRLQLMNLIIQAYIRPSQVLNGL